MVIVSISLLVGTVGAVVESLSKRGSCGSIRLLRYSVRFLYGRRIERLDFRRVQM